MPTTMGAPVAVIGMGLIGASWAALMSAHGHEVLAHDPRPEAETEARQAIATARSALSQLGLDGEGAIRFAGTATEAARGAAFIQETAPERLPLKIELLAELDASAPADAVIASSTSSLLLSEMTAECATPARIVIGHPFNPPHLMPLVEVFGESAAAARAKAFYEGLGKSVIVLEKEMAGHVANRLGAALWREALYMLQEGITDVAGIDRAMTDGPGLRWAEMGPFLTYHLGGGRGGIEHYFRHLGPSQIARWQTLGTPDLSEELIGRAIAGVRAETAGRSIADLEAERDRAVLERLKRRRQPAG
ncbi:MAG: 3-hydroxyacyl-CoA dehydrogenase NAD-binding domain-containing protein [Hyphomicrobiaceae bacterium]